jgi:hypothetical protein
MKPLDLSDVERAYFTFNHALYINDEDQEALIGLTVDESAIYLEVVRRRADEHDSRDAEYLARALEIYDRHNTTVPYGSFSVEALKHFL